MHQPHEVLQSWFMAVKDSSLYMGNNLMTRPLPPAPDDSLFEHAPPLGLQKRLGLVEKGNPKLAQRILLFVLIGWLPIVILTLLQSFIAGTTQPALSLLMAIETHVRYLIVGPLLLLAERLCAPALNAIVCHLVESPVVPTHQQNRLQSIVAAIRRSLQSTTVEIVTIVLVYLLIALLVGSSFERLPVWHKSTGEGSLSPAGWWHLLISLPLMLTLILGWLWRLTQWARLLWGLSRLDLNLIAAHPDHSAGLGFLAISVRAFATVGLAFSTIAAARSLDGVLQDGNDWLYDLYFNAGWIVFVALLFTTPLLVFVPKLASTWQLGLTEYNALASQLGNVFEKKWSRRGKALDNEALQQPDFSATADLYQMVANVKDMRFVPFGLKDIAFLAGILLLPFIPVALSMAPVTVVLQSVKDLFL